MPLDAPISEITGDSHQQLLERLIELASDIGYVVDVCETGNADGTCNRKTKEIKIAKRLSPNGQLAAGIHELAHALLATDEQAPKLSYAQEELVVESIAFCCCQTVGLDTAANSVPYLTSWAERASLETLEETAELTARLSDRIEAVLIVGPAACLLVAQPATPQPGEQELFDASQPVAV